MGVVVKPLMSVDDLYGELIKGSVLVVTLGDEKSWRLVTEGEPARPVPRACANRVVTYHGVRREADDGECRRWRYVVEA